MIEQNKFAPNYMNQRHEPTNHRPRQPTKSTNQRNALTKSTTPPTKPSVAISQTLNFFTWRSNQYSCGSRRRTAANALVSECGGTASAYVRPPTCTCFSSTKPKAQAQAHTYRYRLSQPPHRHASKQAYRQSMPEQTSKLALLTQPWPASRRTSVGAQYGISLHGVAWRGVAWRGVTWVGAAR